MESIRVFIGNEPKQWLAIEVLRCSIQRRTSSNVEFQELKHIPLHLKNQMYTGFSFYRFAIPEICDYQGKAIYLDADMVVLDDIEKLFHLDIRDFGALARPVKAGVEGGRNTSVMLLNNEKLKNWKISDWVEKINKDPSLYNDTLWVAPHGLNAQDFGDLPTYWNDLDHFYKNTKIIHYTNVSMQPWKKAGHPFGAIFLKELKAAMEEDEIPRDAVEREIRQGHLYPELLRDVDGIQS